MIQFHFGSTRLDVYSVGSAIDWAGNNKGSPRVGRFDVIGYPEPCASCRYDEEGLYLVEFDGDVIAGFRPATEADMAELEW
ncbi:hypothetical protein [Kitasatospora sp. McL0602]|uniref:hypothetical protein n=1 Tax=Kitasatospora sp. McL0602 TaxID=3439530 RepID=UPI003F89A221